MSTELTKAERQELFEPIWKTYTASGGEFNAAKEEVFATVETILAARLAAVEAERDQAVEVFALWQKAEYEAHHDTCKSRAELLRQKWQNAEADRRAAEQQLADLRTMVADTTINDILFRAAVRRALLAKES